ncbi:hypothetical protein PR048_024138 [Dryococelus australis]|uniref:Retrotransposon gag domain-containing protein n=1 Tax=Dryococelus australis TaxID=614101 RepID=A0ABQ9GW36_9NEOP|nr:hypothetical protein PR048_024138 [Dryococelus australis]
MCQPPTGTDSAQQVLTHVVDKHSTGIVHALVISHSVNYRKSRRSEGDIVEDLEGNWLHCQLQLGLHTCNCPSATMWIRVVRSGDFIVATKSTDAIPLAEVFTGLKNYFHPKPSEIVETFKFLKCNQKERETIAVYIVELKEHGGLARPAQVAGAVMAGACVGEAVWLCNYASGFKWIPGWISGEEGRLIYHATDEQGNSHRRHADQYQIRRPKKRFPTGCTCRPSIRFEGQRSGFQQGVHADQVSDSKAKEAVSNRVYMQTKYQIRRPKKRFPTGCTCRPSIRFEGQRSGFQQGVHADQYQIRRPKKRFPTGCTCRPSIRFKGQRSGFQQGVNSNQCVPAVLAQDDYTAAGGVKASGPVYAAPEKSEEVKRLCRFPRIFTPPRVLSCHRFPHDEASIASETLRPGICVRKCVHLVCAWASLHEYCPERVSGSTSLLSYTCQMMRAAWANHAQAGMEQACRWTADDRPGEVGRERQAYDRRLKKREMIVQTISAPENILITSSFTVSIELVVVVSLQHIPMTALDCTRCALAEWVNALRTQNHSHERRVDTLYLKTMSKLLTIDFNTQVASSYHCSNTGNYMGCVNETPSLYPKKEIHLSEMGRSRWPRYRPAAANPMIVEPLIHAVPNTEAKGKVTRRQVLHLLKLEWVHSFLMQITQHSNMCSVETSGYSARAGILSHKHTCAVIGRRRETANHLIGKRSAYRRLAAWRLHRVSPHNRCMSASSGNTMSTILNLIGNGSVIVRTVRITLWQLAAHDLLHLSEECSGLLTSFSQHDLGCTEPFRSVQWEDDCDCEHQSSEQNRMIAGWTNE